MRLFFFWLLLLAGAAPAYAAGPETELFAAVKAGNVAATRTLLGQKADVNALEPDGTSALHWAVRAGDAASAELLIRAGARVDAANRYGVTPLSLAARIGRADVIDLLLKSGASIKIAEATLPEGQTLTMHAARTGGVDAVKRLIAAGSDIDARETRTGTTALVWAAVSNRSDVVRALAEAGADLNIQSKVTNYPHTQNGVLLSGVEEGVSYVGQTVLPRGGWSAAMYAAREGAADAARALAESGANLNLMDPEGTTALIIAIINAHWETASVLIEKGADPNLADIKGMTPLYAAIDMHTLGDTFGRPYPPAPVIEGSVSIIKMLLAKGANPNAGLQGPILKRVYDAGDNRLGEGATPFMRAARKCDVAVMKLLLDAGADPKLTQKSGNNALMLAAGAVSSGGDETQRISEEQALAAIKIGIAAGIDVNDTNSNGDTAMHTAATTSGGLHSVIRLLAESGARLDIKNKGGRTALEAAQRARQPNEATISLLRDLRGRSFPKRRRRTRRSASMSTASEPLRR
ncbi:MAG TPA: ankyrin repeat domain-containing protein [Vicinamibacterales bacterium]|nr:ankyrin repeat domain-containing protein [Vicinamibacterales bacterium]